MHYFKQFSVFVGLIYLFTGCLGESAELQQIRQQQARDGVLLQEFTNQMDQIYNTLDQVSQLDGQLRANPNMDKSDAVQKIKIINQLLAARNRSVDSLNQVISKMEVQKRDLAIAYMNEGKRKLELQAKYYEDLGKEVDRLKSENISLQEIIRNKDEQLLEKDEIIERIQTERDMQEKKLEMLNDSIEKMLVELDSTITHTADTYFDLASDLRDLADKTSAVFNKKKKRNMVLLSHQFFTKAIELGKTEAQKEIEFLETEKEFAKYLNDDTSDDDDPDPDDPANE